uniref:glycerate kinase n=1 Tax=Mesonia mobilis TaxID=369791 RepID=UPI0026EA343E
QNPTHTYIAPGTYTVRLTVTDENNLNGYKEDDVTVEEYTETGPAASFSFSANFLEVTFTDISAQGNGDIITWAWDFGDGYTSTEQNPVHTYAEDGTYSVSLTVTDENSLVDTYTSAIVVSAMPTFISLAPGYMSINLDINVEPTGELILHAIEKGAKHILLGIGGSATNDCGMGMAAALGYSFLDANGQKLKPIGANLTQVETIDVSNVQEKLKNIKFSIACDVQNPLYGNEGAAFVYAEQKGASIENILQLDRGLQHFANILQQQFGVDCQQINGAGAAGGVGAGSIVFLNGNLVSGIELIKNISNFDEVIQDADWLITGEGKLDEQTFYGKTIQGVINSAKQNNIPVAAFCGAISLNIEQQQKMGLTYCTSILKTISSLQEAINYSEENLIHSVYNFANLIKFRKKLSD